MDRKRLLATRISIPASLSAFANWLVDHPVAGDRTYSAHGVRYQAARYCEYLHSNPWLGADPLGDEGARDGAVWAYRQYLATFDVEPTGIGDILVNLDRFYVFLGLGAVSLQPSPAREAGSAGFPASIISARGIPYTQPGRSGVGPHR